MNLIWGIILVSATLKIWIGQIIISFFPKVAEKINIIEPKSGVDKTYYLDMRGSAIWDSISLWTLPLAGILLILNNNLWTYFGLIGGSMYLYFVGRAIASNLKLHRNEINIGRSNKLKVKYMILSIWGIIALVTIFMAVVDLGL